MTEPTMQEKKRQRGNPMGMTAAAVASNLRFYRDTISLRELSKLLNDTETPLSASALNRIESGQRRVDVDELVSLASVLEVEIRDFLGMKPLPRDATGNASSAGFDLTVQENYVARAERILASLVRYEDQGYAAEQLAIKLSEAQVHVSIATAKMMLAAMRGNQS